MRQPAIVMTVTIVLSAVISSVSAQEDRRKGTETISQYYAKHGVMTAPGAHSNLCASLPEDITDLCEVVQGLLVYAGHTHRYGVQPTQKRKRQDLGLRKVEDMLTRILEMDNRDLRKQRLPRDRLVASCRHFCVLLVSFLREKGIPARARVGYATYLVAGIYGDHWICEYWNVTDKRWIRVDAVLDSTLKKAFSTTFEPTDVPDAKFLTAGELRRVAGLPKEEPSRLISAILPDMSTGCNIIRDLLALNKMEVLPWDSTAFMDQQRYPLPGRLSVLDRIAATTAAASDLAQIRSEYLSHPEFHPAKK